LSQCVSQAPFAALSGKRIAIRRDIMPMSSHADRQGHVVLRTVLIALSIVVLLVCVLMWWVTVFGNSEPLVSLRAPLPAHSQPMPSRVLTTGVDASPG
jgi:hypothetical protein